MACNDIGTRTRCISLVALEILRIYYIVCFVYSGIHEWTHTVHSLYPFDILFGQSDNIAHQFHSI